MLFFLLANLAVIYNLVFLGAPSAQLLDVGQAGNKSLALIKQTYLKGAPYRINNVSLGMKVSAASAMVVDAGTGLALWQKNQNEIRPSASLAKLLTALVFLEHSPGWNAEITVQSGDLVEGGRAYIYRGEKLLARDLFNLALIPSSNSATMALARSTGLSSEQFIGLMNQKAKELGMSSSKFLEPTGLNAENIISAADIIKLAQAAFAKSEIRQATIQQQYTFTVLNNNRVETVKSTDKLLSSYLSIKAGKTGFLDEAGFNLAAEAEGSKGQRVLVVVLGSDSDANRFQDLKALAQWAFDNYTWP